MLAFGFHFCLHVGHGRQNSMFFSYYYILPSWFLLVNALRAYTNTAEEMQNKAGCDGLLTFSFASASASVQGQSSRKKST